MTTPTAAATPEGQLPQLFAAHAAARADGDEEGGSAPAAGGSGPLLGQARTVTVVGLRAVGVVVEAHVSQGLPGFHVIGSHGAAAHQAADRVRAALGSLGLSLPARKVLVSLAPADVPKVGARFDLAMAVAVLGALGAVGEEALRSTALLGELALDGRLRAVPGVLPAAASLPPHGVRRLLVPESNAAEAALVRDLDVAGVRDLHEALAVLRGDARPRPVPPPAVPPEDEELPDLADVRGQTEARRALEVAAAGGHHLLLLGPPGCGKSMLARRLPSVLPPLSPDEALELAAVRSVAGRLVAGAPLVDHRPPFRSPHHSVSTAALLGGGTGIAGPGELSLAHRGILFLDELYEWPRGVLDTLRQPLEEGVVRVARSRATVTYPCRIQLISAANPCRCGGGPACACGEDAIWAYRSRLSGPLADRLDLAPTVAPLTAAELLDPDGGEPTAAVRERVALARAAAAGRWGGPMRNADAPVRAVRRTATSAALRTLALAVDTGQLTGRGYDRTLRVARTCADLEGATLVARDHVLEARAHRAALPDAAAIPRTR